jgi:hypothetical protein
MFGYAKIGILSGVRELRSDNVKAISKIVATVPVTAFTDGGSTDGTYEINKTIPLGAVVLRSKVLKCVGFAGDTSAVLTVGDGTDVDRYNTGTVDVFTTSTTELDCGVPSGTVYHSVAKKPTITVTTATDFGLAVTNGLGNVKVEIDYIA